MKPITEEQRQALIARLTKIASWAETYGPDHNVMLPASEAKEMAEAYLASLTAEPRAYISESNLRVLGKGVNSVRVKPDSVMVRPNALYTAPPVPVIRLPNDTCLLAQFARIYSVLSIREHRHITRMVLNEVKRLNGLE